MPGAKRVPRRGTWRHLGVRAWPQAHAESHGRRRVRPYGAKPEAGRGESAAQRVQCREGAMHREVPSQHGGEREREGSSVSCALLAVCCSRQARHHSPWAASVHAVRAVALAPCSTRSRQNRRSRTQEPRNCGGVLPAAGRSGMQMRALDRCQEHRSEDQHDERDSGW